MHNNRTIVRNSIDYRTIVRYNIIVVGNFTNDIYILSQKMRKNKRKGEICVEERNELSFREVTLLAIFRELDEFDKGRVCAFAETLCSEVNLLRLRGKIKRNKA